MNITLENTDALNAVLKVDLVKADYDERVANVLKDYRKKARIDGFRPGKVPFGLINKMYGKAVLVEEVNKVLSESMSKYLVDNKLNILGEPLPHEDEAAIDFDTQEEFSFKFDLGLAPELDLKLSGRDKIPFYTIKVDDALIDKQVDSISQRLGELVTSEAGVSEKSTVKVDIKQGEGEEALDIADAAIAIDMMKDEDVKKSVLGKKAGETLAIDLKKAYPNETDLSSLLNIDKEKLAELGAEFELTIKEVKEFKAAEIDQELFDKVYGKDNVKSVEEFRAKMAEEMAKGLINDSEYRFTIDAKDALVKKFKGDLPEEFLKRWLVAINKGKYTMEDIEKEFEAFKDDLKWQLTKDKIAQEQEIKVDADELMDAAKENARRMFAQYGMNDIPENALENFAKGSLEKEEERRKLYEKRFEDKVIAYVKTVVKIDEKEISLDDFNKLFEK